MRFPLTLDIAETAEAAGGIAARRLADMLAGQPDAVLGLATGGTMRPVYAALVQRVRDAHIAMRGVRTFNLDEYVGLGRDMPSSFAADMQALLFGHIDIDPARTDIPDGRAGDAEREATRYEAAIAASGGIDCQLLGIGRNGHIAFNEPGAAADSRTRVVALTPATIADNAAHFPPGAQVPRQAITMGIATILSARRLVVVATGAGKRDAVRAMFEAPIGPDWPCSYLRSHDAVHVVLDCAAAGGLTTRP